MEFSGEKGSIGNLQPSGHVRKNICYIINNHPFDEFAG